jgi:hypothetical protein
MVLESYTCDMCILQRLETAAHLFLRCNFAKACWASIGISVATTRPVPQIINRIRINLGVPFFMEIIILMAWSIWKTRNDWIFNNIDPSVEDCRIRFISEFKLLLHRVKQSSIPQLELAKCSRNLGLFSLCFFPPFCTKLILLIYSFQ